MSRKYGVDPHRSAAGRGMGLLRITLVLGALEAFGPLSMDLYLPQLPQLATSLNTSDALAQATMSVCMIGLGLGQLIAGPLSDRYGRKRPVVIGVALFALLSLLCALTPSIEALLITRFFQGLAGSAGVVISLAVARDLFSGAELSRMLSLLALVASVAPIVAPVIGGQLARFMDWRGVFLVLAGAGVALTGIAAFGLRETLLTERHGGRIFRATTTNLAAIGTDRLFLALLLAAALSGGAFFSYLSMSSFVVQDEFGFTPQFFSLVFAGNACAQLTGAQVSRALVRRFGTARVYLTGQIAGATAALLLCGAALLSAPVPVYLTLLALLLGAAGLGGPNGTALALSGHGARAGTAAALLGMATFTAGAIAAPLISLLAGTSALTLAACLAFGACSAAVVAVLAIRNARLLVPVPANTITDQRETNTPEP